MCGIEFGGLPPIGTKRFGDFDCSSRESSRGRLTRIRCGVGRGNKFVLLDMTEEPEAEKAYSIQHERNLMER